jgi:UPF0755 protein
MYESYYDNRIPKRDFKKPKRWRGYVALAFIIGIFVLIISVIEPPDNFPTNQVITIDSGASLQKIANNFEKAGLIKSTGVFKTFLIAFVGDKVIQAGDYLFDEPLNSWELAKRLSLNQFGIQKIKVTLPEGLTNKEMAETLSKKLPNFNKDEFLYLTKDLEGYLFPDTYYFFGSVKTPEVVKTLRDNFNKKVTNDLSKDIESSGKTFDQIMTMASIIQAEAYDGYVEKQTISGILWKRIDKKMLLQVDSTIEYVNGKDSAHLTISDLAEDNPYNTYVNFGLPPTPIGNPGVEAIKAAIHPISSPYFFYLHDSDGKIHYATTFAEHKKNISLYIKK